MLLLTLISAIATVDGHSTQELTVDDLAKLHSAGIAALRSVELDLEIIDNESADRARPGAKPLPHPEKHSEIHWAMDGEWQFCKMVDYRDGMQQGKPYASLDEEENSPSGYRKFLRGYPDNGVRVSESSEGGFNAQVSQRRSGPFVFKAWVPVFMHMVLPYESAKERNFLPLSELLQRIPSKRISKTPATSSLGCYELVLETDNSTFTIFFDPKRNFWARRVEKHLTELNQDVIMEIDEFEDFPNGISLPKRRTHNASHLGGYDYLYRFSYLSVNQPIDRSNKHVTFPEWARVFDTNKKVIHVWGNDDKPKMTFNSLGEYQNWYNPRRKAPLVSEVVSEGLKEEEAWWRSPWAWVFVGSLAVLVSAFFLRWRHSRASA